LIVFYGAIFNISCYNEFFNELLVYW